MLSSLGNLGDAKRLSTSASREVPVENDRLCNLGYAIYAVRSRSCNLLCRHAAEQTALRFNVLHIAVCILIVTKIHNAAISAYVMFSKQRLQ